MKKILSVLLAVCTLASFATVASAADEPTVKVVVNKVDFTDAAYSAYAGDYDWSPYNEEYGTVYETYSLQVIATGMELKVEAVQSGKTTKYPGKSIVGYQASFSVESDSAEYENDWIAGTIFEFGGDATDGANASQVSAAYTGTAALLPAAGAAGAIGKNDEVKLLEFLVTVDTNKPMTFNFDKAKVLYAEYADTKAAPTATGEFALGSTLVTTTPVIELPVADTPVEPSVRVSDKIDVAAGSIVGAAWDVTIQNFDSAKAYVAKFTDEATGTSRDEGKAIDVAAIAETTGDVSFAVILKLTADRNVALTVDVQ